MSKLKQILFHLLSLMLAFASLYLFRSSGRRDYFWVFFGGINLGNHLSVLWLSAFYPKSEVKKKCMNKK